MIYCPKNKVYISVIYIDRCSQTKCPYKDCEHHMDFVKPEDRGVDE